jgi:hypothetical protein
MGEGVQRVMTIDDEGGGVQNVLKFDDVKYGRTKICQKFSVITFSKISISQR